MKKTLPTMSTETLSPLANSQTLMELSRTLGLSKYLTKKLLDQHGLKAKPSAPSAQAERYRKYPVSTRLWNGFESYAR